MARKSNLPQTVTMKITFVEPTPERIRRDIEFWDWLADLGRSAIAKEEHSIDKHNVNKGTGVTAGRTR
jgi:hypothetical protein